MNHIVVPPQKVYNRTMSREQTKGSAGFVDAHVHLDRPEGLDDVLTAGIAAVRIAGTRPGYGGGDCAANERSRGVEVVSSCWALYKKGGYGSRFGVPVGTAGEIRDEILRLKQAGADIIKIMASGLVSLKDPGTITPGGFSADELMVTVQEAARLGLAVMAHANGETAIVAAARAGVRSIEHGFFMTERALAKMVEKNVFWVPTMGALIRATENSRATAPVKEFIAGLVRQHHQLLRKAYESGVPLAVGTDCVLPDPRYLSAYESELSYFELAGIPHDDVIRIAREGGAALLGI